MPLFAIAALKYLLANRWLWWLGAVLVALAVYFGWRSHQRALGARAVRDQLQRESDEATRKMEEAGRKFRRDGGARKRLRDADF